MHCEQILERSGGEGLAWEQQQGPKQLYSRIYSSVASSVIAYLLLLWAGLKNVIHQHGHQFGHSVNASSVRAIRSRAIDCLSLGFGLLEPLACYRVYDVKNS